VSTARGRAVRAAFLPGIPSPNFTVALQQLYTCLTLPKQKVAKKVLCAIERIFLELGGILGHTWHRCTERKKIKKILKKVLTFALDVV
jgi:hypothetical protein